MRYLSLMAMCWVLASCSHNQLVHTEHFFDEAGNNLEIYDQKYSVLKDFYSDHTPTKVIVRYRKGSSSQFHTWNNSISLSVNRLKDYPTKSVIHETSHLAMNNMTKGASKLDQFRFFDEGMANIMGYVAEGKLKIYKRSAITVANKQIKAKNFSFKKVQDWKNYYGDWSGKKDKFKKRPHAYRVGSTFIFYIQDTFGNAKFKEFLISIGETGDLKKTISKVFNYKMNDFETNWLEYIQKLSSFGK